MSTARQCPDHGYVSGPECFCGRETERLLSGGERERISKFLSGLLRHFPDEYGIELDAHGWADGESVAALVEERYGVPEAALEAIVHGDGKGRYELVDGRVRALYGHSDGLAVDLAVEGEVPDVLYHGTPARNLDSIRERGLTPRSRTHVHLTDDAAEAIRVGKRHGNGVALLVVRTAELEGHRSVEPRTAHTFVTGTIPPEYLDVVDPSRIERADGLPVEE